MLETLGGELTGGSDMTSVFVRAVRPLSVLIVAGLMATTVLATSGSREKGAVNSSATLQTRYASCNGLNFHPVESTTKFGYAQSPTTYLFRDDNASSGFFVCDPALPHGATVTKVQFTVRDITDVSEVKYCSLVREGSAASTSYAVQPMAEAGGTGISEKPGITRLSDQTIAYATVDNAAWTYELQCAIRFSGIVDHSAGIIGATITYKISAANG
jgi:hypothetical protein